MSIVNKLKDMHDKGLITSSVYEKRLFRYNCDR